MCGTLPDEFAMETSLKCTGKLSARSEARSTLIVLKLFYQSLAELATATALSPAYNPAFYSALLEARKGDKAQNPNTLVFIICGGIGISLDEMKTYDQIVSNYLKSSKWNLTVNGEQLEISQCYS